MKSERNVFVSIPFIYILFHKSQVLIHTVHGLLKELI
ncbi:MAG: hypothetical protein ACI8RD_005787 [Bacillariaceae sp.]|jgi:hypothetical protein